MSSILTLPSYLWNSYVDYLWNYDSNSWVATIAYAFRIWAILAILPTLVLALLDVTSYVIARTLGDPTASTSHKSSFATQLPPPESDSKIIANADSTGLPTVLADPDNPDPDPIPGGVAVLRPGEESHSGISTKPAAAAGPGTGTGTLTGATSSSHTFFVDAEGSEDDGAARLAGVGVFSPVASMPGSPTVSRRNFFEKDGEDDAGGSGSSVASGTDETRSPFAGRAWGVLLRSSGGDEGGSGTIHHHHHHHHHQHQHHQGGREAETEEDRDHEHEHSSRSASDASAASASAGSANGGGSTSGESSFAILDREESFEDAGVHIRRRVPGANTAADDE